MAGELTTIRFALEDADRDTTSKLNYEDNVIEQRSLELDFADRPCNTMSFLNKEIDPSRIRRALYSEDAGYIRQLTCFNRSLRDFPSFRKGLRPRQYIQTMDPILLKDSPYFQRYRVGLKSPYTMFPTEVSDDLYEIETASEGYQYMLLHEYFIATNSVNNLFSSIPNFSLVVGYYNCNSPYGDVPCPINGDNNIYLIHEHTDAIPFEQAIQEILLYEQVTRRNEELLNLFLQILFALDMAYTAYDFTHYDLHVGNIYVERFDKPVKIRYLIPLSGEVVPSILQTKYIAKIRNYKRAHIHVGDKDYGYFDSEALIYPDRSYPMYDLYKFITSYMLVLLNTTDIRVETKLVFDYLYEILKLFQINKDISIEDYLRQSQQLGLVYPFQTALATITPAYLFEREIRYIISSYSDLVSHESIVPIYGCLANDRCASSPDMIQRDILIKRGNENPFMFIQKLTDLYNYALPNTLVPTTEEIRLSTKLVEEYKKTYKYGKNHIPTFLTEMNDVLKKYIQQIELVVYRLRMEKDREEEDIETLVRLIISVLDLELFYRGYELFYPKEYAPFAKQIDILFGAIKSHYTYVNTLMGYDTMINQ